MTRPRDALRSLREADWPPADRRAWDALFTEGDLIVDAGPAAHWSFATRRTNAYHYGRYLARLAATATLDAAVAPADRITPEAVDAYARSLIERLSPKSVEGALVGLKVVAKAFAPERDWRWLDALTARVKRWAVPARDRDAGLVPITQIYEAALAELDRLEALEPLDRRNSLAYRDTLIVAIFTVAPIRIRNMVMMDLGRHLIEREGAYELRFDANETKNKRPLRLALPAELAPRIAFYLARVRAAFDSGQTDAAWLRSNDGGRFAENSMYQRVIAVSKRLTGVAINPHKFRTIAATAMADHSPDAARLAAPLLGHAYFGTTERYYIRSRQIDASRKMVAMLERLRKESGENR